MAIDKKLICFARLEEFERQRAAGNILDKSIVLIQDAKKIYNRGTYYDCEDLGERPFFNNSEFNFRATADAQNSIKDGMASIKELRGNSVVWNQLVQNPSEVQTNDITVAFKEGTRIVAGHKYLFFADIESTIDYVSASVFIRINEQNESLVTLYKSENRSYEFFVANTNIVSNGTNQAIEGNVWLYYYLGASGGQIQNTRLIDLTLMFGAGNEPTTIEEYYARKPIVADEYAYNEGEVIHMTAEGIKSVGDNAVSFDGEFVPDENETGPTKKKLYEEGKIYVGCSVGDYVNPSAIKDYSRYGNGFKISSTNGYGIGTLIRVLPNTDYYISCNIQGAGGIRIGWLTRDGYYISNTYDSNRTHRSPSNAYYGLVSLIPFDADNVLFTDIMITLVHSGWKQDTDAGYQEYWEDRLIFDQRIKEHFPNGMQKWDMVYNKNGKGYIVKGTGKASNLDWGYTLTGDGSHLLYVDMVDVKPGGNVLCAQYEAIPATDYWDVMPDKAMCIHKSMGRIIVKDSAYTDAASFKAAMAGVPLYYELATPEVIEYDEPFNLDYKVADFGTEQMLTEHPSAPIAAEIQYNFNANDTIRTNALAIQNLRRNKQDVLVSGTNIKTINGESIIGSGDIVIEGGETLTESDIAAMGFTKNTGTYSKPSGGIPKTDLASTVQTSLGKADTALQSYTEQYKGTITGVSANGTSVATSGVANIPAASTSAYGVTKLSSATNSNSTTLAATASAVKAAYDLANSYKGTVTGVKVNGTTKSPSSGTVDIGNVVTSIKINGSTKTPSSGVVDLGTISGGGSSSGGSGAYPEVNHGTSDTTFTLTPNTFHVWDEVASLTLDFGSETSGVANEFLFQFTSGATATSLTLPDDIKWANDSAPTIVENMIYQVSILKGLASVLEFSAISSVMPITLTVTRWGITESSVNPNAAKLYKELMDISQGTGNGTLDEGMLQLYVVNTLGYYINTENVTSFSKSTVDSVPGILLWHYNFIDHILQEDGTIAIYDWD